ncbi:MAG: alpha/beta fold hydrolase [Almyronema sp.]
MLIPPGFVANSVVTPLGTMVYYASSDADAPARASQTLVFFHGFGGGASAYEWSKVYPAFADRYRVLAADLLGWGRSDHPQRRYQLADYLSTMANFLAQVGQEPVVAIASSLTAAMLIRLAIAQPQLFQALILVAPAGLADFGKDYGSLFAQLASLPWLDQLLYKGAIATELGIRSFLEQRQFARSQRISPEMVRAYWQSAQQPQAEVAAWAFVKGDLCFDVAQGIEQLSMPTALLWGREAQFTPPEIGQRLMALNPQALQAMEILDGVGLTPQLEVPAITIGLIEQWLKVLTTKTTP